MIAVRESAQTAFFYFFLKKRQLKIFNIILFLYITILRSIYKLHISLYFEDIYIYLFIEIISMVT